MKNGYQQFFKKASEVRTKTSDQKITSKSRTSADVERRLRSAVRMKTRTRQPFPWKAGAGLAVSLAAVGFYLAKPDFVESLASKIEINAMGSASAADKKPAEKAAPAHENKEKAAAADSKANPDHGQDAHSAVPEELSHFEKLKQRKDELDAREKELGQLEEELQRQKGELDKRIKQLEDMRNQIAQTLKDRVEIDQEKVNKLVDLYSNMKPKQAADVIGNINEDLAVEVLAKMKKKNAAEIMNLLSPDKAKVLSEKYTGYRRAHAEPKG
jgi:flagellar motility protein MotE (MotC chaperone)